MIWLKRESSRDGTRICCRIRPACWWALLLEWYMCTAAAGVAHLLTKWCSLEFLLSAGSADHATHLFFKLYTPLKIDPFSQTVKPTPRGCTSNRSFGLRTSSSYIIIPFSTTIWFIFNIPVLVVPSEQLVKLCLLSNLVSSAQFMLHLRTKKKLKMHLSWYNTRICFGLSWNRQDKQ